MKRPRQANPRRTPRRGRRSAIRRRSPAPRTAAQYNALPEKSKDTLDRALKVISKVRAEKLSPTKASKEVGISLRTVRRWVGSALKKLGNGKLATKPSDQLIRVIRVPSTGGPIDLPVRGSKQATLLSNYWNEVDRFVTTGISSGLDKFRDQTLKDADGVERPLIVDRAELLRQAGAGVLHFNSLYSRTT